MVKAVLLFIMTIKEAIKARHSVRRYTDTPIEEDKLTLLRKAVAEANEAAGLNIELVTEEPKAFAVGQILGFQYGRFRGVRNYLIMAGPKKDSAKEAIGYYGEKIVLLAQTLGLNSCWVGLSYKEVPGIFKKCLGKSCHCVIALGYGEEQGVQHKLRPSDKFIDADAHLHLPDWFLEGVNAAILAPTAMNQQRFAFKLTDGNQVEAIAKPSIFGYTHIDLGIVKCHFEIAAGPQNFRWK